MTRKEILFKFINDYVVDFEKVLKVEEIIVSPADHHKEAMGLVITKRFMLTKEETIALLSSNFSDDLRGHYEGEQDLIEIQNWTIADPETGENLPIEIIEEEQE